MNKEKYIAISVIVPIYNVAPFIERCLKSLFNQTKTQTVEYILVNDATPDHSMQIAQNVIALFPELSIKIIDKKHNEGLAAARQSGLDTATGEYIITIDSDDWCELTMLEDLYNAAIQNNADIVVCDFFLTYPNKEIVNHQRIPTDPIEVISGMFRNSEIYPSIWSKLIKRSLFTDNDIEWVKGLDMSEDLLICTKLFSVVKKHYHLHKPYVHYNINPTSMTNLFSDKSLFDLIEVVKYIEQYLKAHKLFSQLDFSLRHKKLEYKVAALIKSRGIEQRKFANIFPESNDVIWSDKYMPIYHKIAVYMAVHKCLFASNLIYNSIKIVKRLRG